jgi:MYXO-CTERM domain-containing protein
VFTVGWELSSDEGLELGGWQLDDVCIVANVNSICGDGVKSPTEGCDEGAANADEPDRCRSYCLRPACGDNIVDSDEECDHGAGDTTCSASCKNLELPTLGGCCSATDAAAPGAIILGAIVVIILLRRRRKDCCR